MNQPVDGEGRDLALASLGDWEEKKERVLVAMEEVVGVLPGEDRRCALAVEVEEEVDCGSYVLQLVSYAAEPGGRVPAYLLVPKGSGPFPGVLCPHPTDNVAGHKVVVGLSAKAHRSYASELAERGFVALAPAYPLLADYQPEYEPPTGSYHAARSVAASFDTIPRTLSKMDPDLSRDDSERINEVGRYLHTSYNAAAMKVNELGLPDWPMQIVHSDWHPGNMLFRGAEVVAVIDYDSARLQQRVTDIANGALQLSILGGGDDPAQ